MTALEDGRSRQRLVRRSVICPSSVRFHHSDIRKPLRLSANQHSSMSQYLGPEVPAIARFP